jgi:hypothetical protein
MLNSLRSYDKQLEDVLEEMQNVAGPYTSMIFNLAQIPGLGTLSATYVIAEIGIDMSRFPKGAAGLAKWAGLSPRDDKSAGKIKSSKIMKGNPYVKSVLCQCAWAAVKTRNTRLSNWYWRNVKRLGVKKAIVAVARKLLCYVYHILCTGEMYNCQLDIDDTANIKALQLEAAKKQVSTLEGKATRLSNSAHGNAQGTDEHGVQSPVPANRKTSKEQKSPISTPSGTQKSDTLVLDSISGGFVVYVPDVSDKEASAPVKKVRAKKIAATLG